MKKNCLKAVILMVLFISMAVSVYATGGQESSDTGTSTSMTLDYDPTVGAMKAPANRGDVIDIPFKAQDHFSVSFAFSDASWYAYDEETWRIWDDIANATNIELDLVVIPFSDYNNKRSLLISTGDQPMIMPKTYPGQEVPYIPSGQILPISDYIDYMPNFKATIEKWDLYDDLKTITQKDGKFYIAPGLHETYIQDYSMCIRTDILDELGLKVPQSWEEIEDVLKAMKDAYPDLYPYAERWQLGMTMGIAGPAFGLTGATGLKTATVNWNNNNAITYDKESDSFSFYPTTDEYKDMLDYFAGLIEQGLLDPESISRTDEDAVDNFCNGNAFLIGCNSQGVNEYRTKMDDTLGKGNYEVMRINVPAGPAGGKIMGTRLENGVMISARAKEDPHFLEILRLVDWIWYSYSGQEMCKWGIEGKTYKFEDGKYSLLPGLKLPAYGIPGTSEDDLDLRITYGYAGGNLILSWGGPRQLQYSFMNEESKAFVEEVSATRELMPPPPVVLYDEEELEMQNLIVQPLMDYVFQMTYKFILGQSDLDTEWDDFVDQCVKKGSDRYIDKANAVYSQQ